MTRRRNLLLGVGVFVLLLLARIAWATDGPNRPTANEDIAINEVFYKGATSAEDWIELRNTGNENIDVSNWWFCARFDYERVGALQRIVGDDFILTPGELLVVRPWTDLDDSASDLALYIDGNFFSASSLVDFVQWGSGASIGRANVAVSKGIWRQLSPGQFDFVPGAGTGQSIAWSGTNSGGGLLTHSQDWSAGAPSQGNTNPPPAATATPTVTPTITPTPTVTPTATPTATPIPLHLPMIVKGEASRLRSPH